MKLNREKIANKHVNLLFLLVIVCFISIQTIKAQGPTSPESRAFEPVDATDMVNLLTGDFTYVLPLAEVPSPEGGYPIVLSYHAGIAMDQEASWVGLGWSLNPGAINRDINGYADDWNNGKTSSILYDAGGETKSFSLGVSKGIPGFGSIGQSFSYSENRTYGGETNYRFDTDNNVGIGWANSHFGANASIGTSGIGFGVGINSSKSGKSGFGAGLGLNSFQSFANGKSSFSASLGLTLNGGKSNNNEQVLGVSFSSSRGLGTSINGRGVNLSGTINNTNSIVYNNSSINVPIPIPGTLFFVNVNYNRSKYYLFDNQYNSSYGALYPGAGKIERSTVLNPKKVMSDNSESIYKLDKELQQEEENNFTFITKDSYRVSGQGISGSISPGFYEGSSQVLKSIIGKTSFYGDFKVSTRNINDSTDDIFFNFENSFSSHIRMKPGLWETPLNSISEITDLNILGKELTYSIDINGELKTGYDAQKGRKKDGYFVEVFINSEITASKIIEVNSGSGFDRQILKQKEGVKDGIGAYRITTLDGKIYHYSLPVYQKEKFTRNSELDKNDELRFQENLSFTPYATHWLLTAITGPDYVDVNTDGKLDDGDYGYWVEFDYGKWSDGFAWSSPANEIISNSNKDNLTYYKDNKAKSYSWGVKEIYYLDKIRTRTHTAFFIKEQRLDNTATEISFSNTNYKSRQLSNVQVIDGVGYLQGFEHPTFNYSNYNFYELKYAEGNYNYSANMNDQKSLFLKEIQIVKNKDLTNQLNKSNSNRGNKNIGNIHINQINKFFDAANNEIGSENLFDVNNNYFGEYYNYVYDKDDGVESNRNNSQKIIEFNYDYSLSSNTPNSSDGKLTLKNVVFKQKGGISVMPPFSFTYNKNLQYNYEKQDLWGYYKNNPDAWSLNTITTPTGGEIKIDYESDDYDEEIVGKYETYTSNFQFIIDEYNGKLRIKVQNENNFTKPIDFTKKFQLGLVNMDLWLCYKRDYRDWTCQTRSGNIDIENQNLNIISVTSTELTLEANVSAITNYRGGLNEIYNSPIGLNYHPGIIREERSERGNCAEPPGCDNVSPRLVLEYFLIGNKIIEDKNAGGIRVKQLELTNGNSSTYTNYYYNAEGYGDEKSDINYKSSGVTSYTPSKIFKEVKFISELPSPSVMYNRVTVENTGSNGISDFKTVYKFRTLNTEALIDTENRFAIPNLLDINIIQNIVSNINVNSVLSEVNIKNFDLKKNFSSLGQLISKEILNNKGQILTKTENIYSVFKDSMQGINQESIDTYKKSLSNDSKYLVTTTSRTKYPSVLEKVTTTQGNFNVTQYFEKYDFLTGQVLETRTYASDGKAFKSKTVPAYTIPAYATMGSKVDDINNKNMLTQSAASFTYLLDETNNTESMISAGITTWNNDWSYRDHTGNEPLSNTEVPVWRKHKSFVWKGAINNEGIYTNFIGEDDNFNWGIGATQASTSNWQKASETTRYDHYSMSLEGKDINDNYASTKMGDGDSKVLAVSNAAYVDMYYSGAEYLSPDSSSYFDGEIKSAGYTPSTTAHTGDYVVAVSTGNAFEVAVPARAERNTPKKQRFKVSVWVRTPNKDNAQIKVGGATVNFTTNETQTAGDWSLLNGYITISPAGATVAITSTSGTIELDDFRLHPITSSMTSYVYNEWDEVSYVTGANGLSTHYFYDKAGRLEETWVEVLDLIPNPIEEEDKGGFKRVSKNSYNYKNQ
jgi:hypothetical protein